MAVGLQLIENQSLPCSNKYGEGINMNFALSSSCNVTPCIDGAGINRQGFMADKSLGKKKPTNQ